MRSAGILVPCILIALGCQAAEACCGVSGGGGVSFGRQRNLIVWDSVRKVERFVRNAEFSTKATSLGFIAPTPSKPALAEVDAGVFDRLVKIEARLGPFMGCASSDEPGAPKADAAVEVERVKVAGYNVAILRAGDARALTRWLGRHGYRTTPDVDEWIKVYVAQGWYLTAFKVDADSGRATTGAVMMTFGAERPFNPYRVPKSNHASDGGAALDVAVISDSPMVGTIGKRDPWVAASATGTLSSAEVADIGKALKIDLRDETAKRPEITFFHDWNFAQRESDDVFFQPDPQLTATWIKFALGVLASATMYAIAMRLRRQLSRT